MAIERTFDNNELFGIKVRDPFVRTGVKVATVRAFTQTGTSNRPGFNVGFTSTEGVGGTSQVIRFESREIAQNWINRNAASYGYSIDEMSIMATRPGHFVKIPLCNYEHDAWVNSVFIGRIMSSSPRNWERIKEACPQYFGEDASDNALLANSSRYRGFRF